MIPAELQKFLEAAKSQGASDETLVGLLRVAEATLNAETKPWMQEKDSFKENQNRCE